MNPRDPKSLYLALVASGETSPSLLAADPYERKLTEAGRVMLIYSISLAAAALCI